jgi:hypothetical protein
VGKSESKPSSLQLAGNPSRRRDFYAKIGVTEEQVLAQPAISPKLMEMSRLLRQANKSSPVRLPLNPLYYLRYSDAPEARTICAFLRERNLWHVTRISSIEAVCVATGISTLRVLEIITAMCVNSGMQTSAIVAAVNHPAVVKATVAGALLDDGKMDRSMLHKATGFLPTPKGSTTVVNVRGGGNVEAESKEERTRVLVSPEESIRRLATRFQQSEALSANAAPALAAGGASDSAPVDAEIVDSDDTEDDTESDSGWRN